MRKPKPHKLDSLRIVCTDRGQHNNRQLCLFVWSRLIESPADLSEPGQWLLDDETCLAQIDRPAPTIQWSYKHEDYRLRAVGVTLPTRWDENNHVDISVRSDGGRTFTLQPCPVCGRTAVLRDDTLTNYFRKTYSTRLRGVLDISEAMGYSSH